MAGARPAIFRLIDPAGAQDALPVQKLAKLPPTLAAALALVNTLFPAAAAEDKELWISTDAFGGVKNVEVTDEGWDFIQALPELPVLKVHCRSRANTKQQGPGNASETRKKKETAGGSAVIPQKRPLSPQGLPPPSQGAFSRQGASSAKRQAPESARQSRNAPSTSFAIGPPTPPCSPKGASKVLLPAAGQLKVTIASGFSFLADAVPFTCMVEGTTAIGTVFSSYEQLYPLHGYGYQFLVDGAQVSRFDSVAHIAGRGQGQVEVTAFHACDSLIEGYRDHFIAQSPSTRAQDTELANEKDWLEDVMGSVKAELLYLRDRAPDWADPATWAAILEIGDRINAVAAGGDQASYAEGLALREKLWRWVRSGHYQR